MQLFQHTFLYLAKVDHNNLMNFSELSQYFQKLEKTTMRNSMVEILAELFKKTTPSEIAEISYLLQGRVVPLYNSLEFQMADKTVIEAIAKSLKTSKEEVVRLFKQKGDLGAVAEELKVKKKYIHNDLSIHKVYKSLYDIAKTTGGGSVDKKIDLLSRLLTQADSLSARYIVRIPVDKLRLGFSDMTILDSLSWMINRSKEYRPKIERAYNLRPDLGYIGKTIKSKGVSGLEDVTPTPATPILMARADRLTSPGEILDKIGACAIEFKYDGLRLQVHKKGKEVTLFSRNLENITSMFPDIVAGVNKQVASDEVIFEGEVVAYNPKNGVFIPFQQTMQRKRKYNIAKKAAEIPVKLFVFELLFNNSTNYIGRPYKERKDSLKKLIKPGNVLIYAEEEVVSREEEIEKLFDESLKQGFEGIIAKRLDGAYQAGMRGFNWIKFKKAMSARLMDTFDVLVMGYTKGEGKRTIFGVGQFLTGVYDQNLDRFVTISKIGTGLTDEQFREFIKRVKPLEVKEKPKSYEVDKLLEADIWLKPSLVVEVAADEITRSQVHTSGRIMGPSKSGKAQEVKSPGYALRFPRLISFRDDKKPKDATTLTEVIKMFEGQKK